MTNTQLDQAMKILPSWFIPRMMSDCWCFGLLLNNSLVIMIETITEIHTDASGALWIDVNMADSDYDPHVSDKHPINNMIIFASPTRRREATIRVDAIVAAFELWDS